ncbi:FAD-dependent monooxygenase [Ideonella dechloratans]|uniref:FAD-dependent monooxygenase n=1 Tax=Ideonella dechloratans TaxID=36863 RepID=UPI001B86F474|nr:FAD-dependent monooxygenase [Ideonella dechloratans]UFU09820.1 FAD-dependent monooxygenase [Ideonella dechloratans]
MDTPTSATPALRPLRLAVIGAGPAGLALALLAAREWPEAAVTVFDARPADKDVSGDPRTLALSLGSVQLLQRLKAWPEGVAQPITQVHVSQVPPTFNGVFGRPLPQAEVRITAQEQAVPMLGAVLSYGQVVAPLQAAWVAACAAQPGRCAMRFGTPVAGLKNLPAQGGVEVDAGIVETFDLAVVAEGGVFADQARKAVVRDYHQNAWVGPVTLDHDMPPGLAMERFTRHGPLALLPLKPAADGRRRASLVWCVPSQGDPVAALDDAQRLTVINSLLPDAVGRLTGLGPLKCFALGLNAERTLVQGRQVRIGNAAQTLHPVAGQGLNLGLRDAFALVQALRHAKDVDAALRRIEWQRAPDRWSMIAATDFLARSFTWHWPGLGALRGLGLAALQALPPARHALARQMMYGRR